MKEQALRFQYYSVSHSSPYAILSLHARFQTRRTSGRRDSPQFQRALFSVLYSTPTTVLLCSMQESTVGSYTYTYIHDVNGVLSNKQGSNSVAISYIHDVLYLHVLHGGSRWGSNDIYHLPGVPFPIFGTSVFFLEKTTERLVLVCEARSAERNSSKEHCSSSESQFTVLPRKPAWS